MKLINSFFSWHSIRNSCDDKVFSDCFLKSDFKYTKSFECPLLIDPKNVYNDSFARYVMFPIAASTASEDSPASCLRKAVDDAQVIYILVLNIAFRNTTRNATSKQ